VPDLRQGLIRLVVVGSVVEAGLGVAAFVMAGPMALAATVVGSGIAMAAQIAAVVLLSPAMQAATPQFTQRWAIGVAIRFGSFVVAGAVMVAARDVLPPAWLAAGYLGMLLTLLFLETKFLT
jgi:hypothetical protein